MKKIYSFAILLMFLTSVVNAANRFSVASGNWNSVTTWSATSGGTPGASVPVAGDIVTIEGGFTVTVTANAACASITFTTVNASSTLNFNTGITLTVSGAITLARPNGSGVNTIAAGAGILNAGSIAFTNAGSGLRHLLTITTGTVTVSGNVTQDNPGTVSPSITFTGTGLLRLGGTIWTSADGTFTTFTGSTVEYNAAGAQTVGNFVYSNLTLSGSLAKTVTGATVNGTISRQGTATVTGSPTYGATSTLEYAGSSAQTSTNSEFPAASGPANLKINNSSGVTLHAARSISGSLTLTNGILNTTGTNILTFNAGATSGFSSDASFVNGPVRKIFNAAEAFTFPIGVTGTGDEPLGIAGAAAGNDFTAQYVRSSATALGGVTAPLKNVSNCDQWTLTKNSAPAASVSVTLSWDANSPCNAIPYITSPSDLTVAHFTGPNWDVAGTSGSFTGTSTAGSVTRNAVSVFSPFAIGNTAFGANPLPVKLANLTGYEKQSGVQIDWTAYSENKLSRYEIERSADGKTFNTVGQVAALNAITETKYGWFDAAPLSGVNFYRLKNVDMDAKYGYSSIIKVNLDKSNKAITVYPNPVQGGNVSFQSSDLAKGNYTVRIYNNSGQQVYSQNFTHNGGAISKTIQLPQSINQGMYALQLENDGSKVMSKPFMVQ